MAQKKITFFVVTSESGKTHKIVLSVSWLKGLLFLLVIGCFALVAGVIDYGGLLSQAVENKRLKAENSLLLSQFQVVEGKLSSLESSLERVKTFTTKLRLITNIDSEERSLKLAAGVKNQVTEIEPPSDPKSAPPEAEMVVTDDNLAVAPRPVDVQNQELVREDGRDYKTLAIRIERATRESQLREQSVLDLWELLSERQSLLASTPNIKPARGWISSLFGYRISPFTGKSALHAGLDIAASPGTPFYAPADGVVSYAGYDESYGKLISIDHGYGVITRYGHCSQIYVRVGQKISRYDLLGTIGNTGRSTGPHLHYEVRVNGVPRDPALYILDE